MIVLSAAAPTLVTTDMVLCLDAQRIYATWGQALAERNQIPFPTNPTEARVEAELRLILQSRASVKIECHPL